MSLILTPSFFLPVPSPWAWQVSRIILGPYWIATHNMSNPPTHNKDLLNWSSRSNVLVLGNTWVGESRTAVPLSSYCLFPENIYIALSLRVCIQYSFSHKIWIHRSFPCPVHKYDLRSLIHIRGSGFVVTYIHRWQRRLTDSKRWSTYECEDWSASLSPLTLR